MAQDAGRERQDCGARMTAVPFSLPRSTVTVPRRHAIARATIAKQIRTPAALQSFSNQSNIGRVAAEWPSATRVDARAPLVADRARARDRGIGSLETLDECARIPRGRAHRDVAFEAPQEAIGAFILAQRTSRFEDARRADKCIVIALESAVLEIPKLAGADIDGSRACGPQQPIVSRAVP